MRIAGLIAALIAAAPLGAAIAQPPPPGRAPGGPDLGPGGPRDDYRRPAPPHGPRFRHHHRRCRTIWRHHHRVRRCY